MTLIFYGSIVSMFEHDRSAARGMMATRGLYVFEHESKMGNAPAQNLFNTITVSKKADVIAPRSFQDYEVKIADLNFSGVKLHKKVG